MPNNELENKSDAEKGFPSSDNDDLVIEDIDDSARDLIYTNDPINL